MKTNNYPGDPLPKEDELNHLYHYTSFDTFIKIWLGKALKFGDITLMNDICESRKQFSTPLTYGYMERWNLTMNLLKPFKQISFTKDYDTYTKGSMSPYMWGHYGNKNNGVCIQFNTEKLMLNTQDYMFKQSVKYVDILETPFMIPHTLNGEKEIKDFLVVNRDKLFFMKHKDWRAENEFRIISDKDDFLDIRDSIDAVYTTDPNSMETKYLERLLLESIPVMVFGYTSAKGLYLPKVYNAKEYRDNLEESIRLNENIIIKNKERRRKKK